jgi:hypothetical protein
VKGLAEICASICLLCVQRKTETSVQRNGCEALPVLIQHPVPLLCLVGSTPDKDKFHVIIDVVDLVDQLVVQVMLLSVDHRGILSMQRSDRWGLGQQGMGGIEPPT